MSCYSLKRLIKSFEETGSLEAKPRSGRPSTCKSVAVTVLQNAEAIETLSPYGEEKIGLKIRKKLKVHVLKPHHIEERKTYSRALYEKYLEGEKWKNVVTLDEAWVYLNDSNIRRAIYYANSQINTLQNWVNQCKESSSKGFMIVAGFCYNGKLPIKKSRQDKDIMELNQDPIGVKTDNPTKERGEDGSQLRENEQAGERQEMTGRETTAPLADIVTQLSALLTRTKISDGAKSIIALFDGTYSATQFFQAFDRKMEDASMGEQEKLLRLPNYLVRQPLELFRKLRLADRSYFQVRQILLDLYPESSEASFAKYFAMKLTGQANLETYYREKTAMGLQLGLPQEVILETLTEGLPFNDQRLVRVVPPENLGEWFRLVQRIHGPSVPTTRPREDQPPTMSVLRREALAQRMPTSTSPDDPRKGSDSANGPKITSLDSTTTKSSQRHPNRAALSRLRTISRRLVANGLHSCRPLRRLPLTPPNRRQRLEWCRARSTWMTEWHRVVFSDESRFCLSSDSRRVSVWRRRGERSNPAAIVERPTVRQRGIKVWGAIAYDYRSPLLRIQGTMTAQRYVDDVLRPVTLPYLQGVPNALYQQDNARPHTARISQQALQDVQMLPWPPYSPDLSPIEHVWNIIGRRLHALPQPRSEDELWQMVEREWRAIPQDAIRTLIDSLPRRVAACIAVRGSPTCY
ncbi:hypothetical protein LAZ67_23001514 [Cordylochernes scorpioides]|uniref:Transposase n=1 Tax=Cordylochernes scorpioides TaxID=51811 RepID=A0ABY6LQT3_9ARAC|nr:hypothetical protein LAZ67_23001514 [Cordylochernes scorpioides]